MELNPATFWQRVRLYRSMGLDPLKWIAGCSVEVEAERVLLPAATGARQRFADLAATVQLGEPTDVFEAREHREPGERVVVRPAAPPKRPRAPARANPRRAALTVRAHQSKADAPEPFAEFLGQALAGLPGGPRGDAPITIGQLHAVTTPDAEAEFAAFEFFGASSGEATGYLAARSESLQIADATLDPLAEDHVQAVVAAAVAGPLALGAAADLELIPLFDGPGRKARDTVAASYRAVAAEHGLKLIEREPLGVGKLFLGATAVGFTDREPPNRHHYVKRGMQVTLTRPLGDLAPLAVSLTALSDADYQAKAEAAGFDAKRLEAARKISHAALTSPAVREGRTIHDFSPSLREPPELNHHIAATADLGPRGVVGLSDFARRYEVEIRVDHVPLADGALSRFATAAHLMDNATASAPGAIAIVAYPDVLDAVERALEDAHGSPVRVATIERRGGPAVRVKGANEWIAAKRLRALVEAAP